MADPAPRSALAARAAIVVAALLAGALIVDLELDRDRCADAGRALFLGAEGQSDSEVDAAVRTLRESCAGSPALVAGSVSLIRAGRPEDATPLARAATEAEPENWAAWSALGLALGGQDGRADAARRALRRAQALNPFEAPAPG